MAPKRERERERGTEVRGKVDRGPLVCRSSGRSRRCNLLLEADRQIGLPPGSERGEEKERETSLGIGRAPKGKQCVCTNQACKLKFRLKDLTSCLCSAAAPAVCFKGLVAGVDATETGNEFSQLKF